MQLQMLVNRSARERLLLWRIAVFAYDVFPFQADLMVYLRVALYI
jgi:hypothetical protein